MGSRIRRAPPFTLDPSIALSYPVRALIEPPDPPSFPAPVPVNDEVDGDGQKKDLVHYMVASYVQHCYRQSLFCDLILEAESESIHCHKMVLFSVFPRFRHFLAEHAGDVIILPEVPGEQLRELVNNIYWHLHERETSLLLPEGLRALGLFHEPLEEHTLKKKQRRDRGVESAALGAQTVKVKMEEAAQAVPNAAALISSVPDPFTGKYEKGSKEGIPEGKIASFLRHL